jgi:hypothetical protein
MYTAFDLHHRKAFNASAAENGIFLDVSMPADWLVEGTRREGASPFE